MPKAKTKKDLEAVRALTLELDSEPSHVFQVCKTALAIFDQTMDLHGLGENERAVFEAAALLHDTGYERDADTHHKQSRDIILKLDLPGFTAAERRMAACIARYHRKGPPQPGHRVYRDLRKKEQNRVRKLAAILRVADGMDRMHAASVDRVEVVRDGDVVRIVAHQAQPSPGDLHGGLRKGGLFEEEFGVRLEIVAASGTAG
jgi:exopolyphosphatase/guanosine-5'-triphosphate,3'-diphosphate pyrophosphatase